MTKTQYCLQVKYRGDSARVHQLSLASLLPNTGDYVTYEVGHSHHGHYPSHCHHQGSTTYPGCWETVTWLVMNKPLYLSKQEMELFHGLRQVSSHWSGDTAHSDSILCSG